MHRIVLKVGLFCLLLIILSSCGGGRYTRPEGSTMVASWYGDEFHGRPTASGEIFNMYDYTAAHRTLPFGTRLRLINPENGRSVVVRINDRGPFVRGRDIDISYAAARKLRILQKGTATLYVQYLGRDPTYVRKVRYSDARRGPFTIQVASFQVKANALRLKRVLEDRYSGVYIHRVWLKGSLYYRVRIGRYQSLQDAREVAEALASEGYEVMVLTYEEVL